MQKGVGHLHQDAGAVAGVGFAAARSTVVEVDEDFKGLADDLVGFFPFDIDQESHPAGVVLEGGVVETLFRRQSG